MGDDPFTDDVEPSIIPFTLGVAVKNGGYGTVTAHSLKISSGQESTQ